MLCSCAVGGRLVFWLQLHTNGGYLMLGKQHAICELLRLGIPQQEFNDNRITGLTDM